MSTHFVWPLAGGLFGAPLGGLAGLAIAYLLLAWNGTTEYEGRRGLLAAVYGILPGLIAGFMAGYQAVIWSTSRYPGWRAFIAGISLGLLLALILFGGGLIAGIRWAEARGVSNYAGERAAWGLFYVAFPLAFAGGVGGFFIGRWLA